MPLAVHLHLHLQGSRWGHSATCSAVTQSGLVLRRSIYAAARRCRPSFESSPAALKAYCSVMPSWSCSRSGVSSVMRPAASRSSAGALSRALPAPLARQCGTHSRVIGTAQLRQISSTQGLLLPGSETKSEPAPARKLARYSYPSLESIAAEPPPRRFSEFDNETIALLAGEGVYGAFKERLLREIMRVDRCSYVEAYRVLGEMNVCNEQGMWLRKLPYTLGIGGTAAVGTLAVPAVFHRGTLSKAFARRNACLHPRLTCVM